MQKTKKINLKFILKYMALFFVSLLLANARVSGVSPFLFAFFFAGIFVGMDEKLLAVFTLSASMLTNMTLNNLYVSITVVAVGLIMFYVFKLMKRKINLITVFCCYILSLVTYIYYFHSNIKELIIYIILGLICLYVFIVVFQCIDLKKNCFKLTLDESICFLFFIAVLGLGLAPVYIINFSIYRLVLMTLIFLMLATNNPTLTLAISISFSLGVALNDMSLSVVAEFAILTLLSSLFSLPNKWKISLVVILTDVFIQYFFLYMSVDFIYAVLPIIVSALIFLCIPKKVLNSIADFVYVKKSEITSRNLINQSRKSIRKRMSELSNVFLDMKQIHLNMVKKELIKDELIAMLEREVMNNCCKDCLEKNRCMRSLTSMNKSNLDVLIELAITKGKITLLDIPNSLSSRCLKVNNLITLINRLTDEYRQYKSMLADVNNVKILLADQMGAVSRLLLDMGEEIDSNITFDLAEENKIISKLLSNNIECKEVLLYNEKNNDKSVMVVVKGGAEIYPILEKVVGECLKIKMQVEKVEPIDDGIFISVNLKTKPKYDCVFGLSSVNKSGNDECGDCHSIIRLNKNRFLLALCDGMGSGKSAHMMSAMTLGLIENFYKAGFDNDTILESVNKLLAINNQENYSTLDVCLIDLDRELGDFIKVGAPFGLIKREGGVELIEGGALPIGALDNIRPSVKQYAITTKDIVILATDGITDAFISQENMIEYVSKLATNNPQTIAESILNEALRLNEMQARDDMTVLVARTYLK